jgi:cysteine synthase B
VRIFAKLEYYNLTASVKARAASSILQRAEREGKIQAGSVILDASSGNTGIAYAALAAMYGYTLKLCLPSNANQERKAMLQAYGAECILTSPLEGSDGAIREAQRLARENPEWFYCDQYSNDANWMAHYEGTGPEIWNQTNREVTHFFSSLGTSGTFVGTSKYLKEVSNGRVQCFSVQPDSPFHGLEGMKHMESAIVPAIYEPDLATEQLEASTEEAFVLISKVARTQGLLIGPSCAAALLAAIEYSEQVEDGIFVVIFPDSGERYLSDAHLWNQGDTE